MVFCLGGGGHTQIYIIFCGDLDLHLIRVSGVLSLQHLKCEILTAQSLLASWRCDSSHTDVPGTRTTTICLVCTQFHVCIVMASGLCVPSSSSLAQCFLYVDHLLLFLLFLFVFQSAQAQCWPFLTLLLPCVVLCVYISVGFVHLSYAGPSLLLSC